MRPDDPAPPPNSLESHTEQYNSITSEKTLADRSQRDPRLLQLFPSSEPTGAWTNPGTNPTFSHRAIAHPAEDHR